MNCMICVAYVRDYVSWGRKNCMIRILCFVVRLQNKELSDAHAFLDTNLLSAAVSFRVASV